MVRSVGLIARQSWFLPVVLVGISAVSSWEFACITPFVAFAVAAGYALSAWAALLTLMAIWLVNQVLGFTVLGYPWTVDTMLWGFAIGATALLAAVLASAVMRLRLGNNVIAIGAAFVVAFAAYEGGLFLMTFTLGGQDAFTPAIVGHVALLNLEWTVGLVGTYEILRYSGAITVERRRVSSAPFPVSGGFPLTPEATIFPLERIVCRTEETVETRYLLGEQHRIVGSPAIVCGPPEARRDKPRVSAYTSADITKILALVADFIQDHRFLDSFDLSEALTLPCESGLAVLVPEADSLVRPFRGKYGLLWRSANAIRNFPLTAQDIRTLSLI